MADLPRILVVDDEPNVLSALQRHLRSTYTVETAAGGPAALELLALDASFAVVVSDMRMPGMTGARFLAAVHDKYPLCVRVLLTGQTDLASAIEAVNDGQIFRFLTKPCPPERLTIALAAAVKQHRLLNSERVLLEHTVAGCVRALEEVLSVARPEVYGRAARIARLGGAIARRMEHPAPWEVEVAAVLGQVGAVLLTESAGGAAALRSSDVWAASERLVAHLPRLEEVQRTVAALASRTPIGDAPKGAQILSVAQMYDDLRTDGLSQSEALTALAARPEVHALTLHALVEHLAEESDEFILLSVGLATLRAGMILTTDLTTANGVLLLAHGTEINDSLLLKLRSVAARVGVQEPIRVRVRRRNERADRIAAPRPQDVCATALLGRSAPSPLTARGER